MGKMDAFRSKAANMKGDQDKFFLVKKEEKGMSDTGHVVKPKGKTMAKVRKK